MDKEKLINLLYKKKFNFQVGDKILYTVLYSSYDRVKFRIVTFKGYKPCRFQSEVKNDVCYNCPGYILTDSWKESETKRDCLTYSKVRLVAPVDSKEGLQIILEEKL